MITAKSYIIPTWDMKLEAKEKYRQQTQEALVSRASHKTGSDHFTVRELRYQDLGLTSWRTPKQLPGVKTTWVNHESKRGQFIAIYGLMQLSLYPKVSGLRIRQGYHGSIISGLLDIEKLYSILPLLRKIETIKDNGFLKDIFGDIRNMRMEGYFAEPYIWDEEYSTWIETESSIENKRGDHLVLLGFVAEVTGLSLA